MKDETKRYIDVIGLPKLDWFTEIEKCITIGSKTNISIPSLLKEVMINNGISLRYENIERMKIALLQLKKYDTENIGFERASEIFLSKEDKKYMPLTQYWLSHITIRQSLWDNLNNHPTAPAA
jgi:hypothetical protein